MCTDGHCWAIWFKRWSFHWRNTQPSIILILFLQLGLFSQGRILKFSAKTHKLQTGKGDRDSSGREKMVCQLSVFRLSCLTPLTPTLPLCLVIPSPTFPRLDFFIYVPLPAKAAEAVSSGGVEVGIWNSKCSSQRISINSGFCCVLFFVGGRVCFVLFFSPFFHWQSEVVQWASKKLKWIWFSLACPSAGAEVSIFSALPRQPPPIH